MKIGKYKITKFKLKTCLKCPRCKHKNVSQALYCYKCGYEFKSLEKEEAKKHGLPVYIKMFFDWTSKFKFKDWKIWKILSIFAILYTGLIYVYQNGYQLKLEKSDEYTFSYSKQNKEYYVYLNQDSKLKLYLPHETDSIYVYHYNEKNELIEANTFDNPDNVKLVADDNSKDYYIIAMNNGENRKNEMIKVLTYTKNKDKNEVAENEE